MSPARHRPRDAARSRELLLTAAGALFAERGYERTTIRDIGERAGVDPALIARYFGGKSGLYIAALQVETGTDAPPDLLDADRLRTLFDRVGRRGTGPIFRSAVQPHDDPVAQQAARAQLQARLVDPLHDRFTREGVDQPRLRAELAAAAFVGVLLARNAGALDSLAAAETDDLVPLMQSVLAALAA
ncbi:TetR family transcriptional regulator [Streptomyces sp. NPDC002676]